MDTNTLLYLVEGTIEYVKEVAENDPDLRTLDDQLKRILSEINYHLEIVRSCSLDGRFYISDRVFYDEVRVKVLEAGRNLPGLSKYYGRHRRAILQMLGQHFTELTVIPESEIETLLGQLKDPQVGPRDRDASLIVLAHHLAEDGLPVAILTSDPDFIEPIRLLMGGHITLGEGDTSPVIQIIYRDYLSFVLSLHRCCKLASDRYGILSNTYITLQLLRVQNPTEDDLSTHRKFQRFQKRIIAPVREWLRVINRAVQDKCATTA